jgi:hypothetical protein
MAQSFTDWDAESWDDLRNVWRELIGEFSGDSVEPRCRGTKITPQQAGYVFQTWIVKAFRLSRADVEPPFPVSSVAGAVAIEQVDGIVYDGWAAFLIESKFQVGNPVSFDSIARLRLLVERRAAGVFGLMFAPFGFTPAALNC